MTGENLFLTDLFRAAIAAADPVAAIRARLPPPPSGRLVVVGFGKAATRMARIVEENWPGPLQGIVVDRHGALGTCARITVLHAAHPVPDQAGLAAAEALLGLVGGLGPDDLVLALVSGGGSALLPAPAEGLMLDDEIAVNRALLASGAPIGAMNAIRQQFSRIKGGRLAAAAFPARVVSLIVSDVPGDDPAIVASGPTIAASATAAQALDLVRQHRIDLPPAAMRFLTARAAAGDGDRLILHPGNEHHVIASAAQSLAAAADMARQAGYDIRMLGDAIEGEARDLGRKHAALAHEIVASLEPVDRPVLVLSGGETTVTLAGMTPGTGGRNTEYLLALVGGIDGMAGIHVLAADTDGIDGNGGHAGAFADGTSAARMRALRLDPQVLLDRHDSAQAFAALGDLFTTGPTGTNVNDFRAMLIRPA